MDPDESLGTHILLRNLVWLIQLWSTFMIRLPFSSMGSIVRAYCYLRTKQRSELPWIGTVLAKRYPIPRSFLITCRTNFKLTSISPLSSTLAWTCWDRTMGLLIMRSLVTTSSIADLFYSSLISLWRSCSSISGFFENRLAKELTNLAGILYYYAISLCNRNGFFVASKICCISWIDRSFLFRFLNLQDQTQSFYLSDFRFDSVIISWLCSGFDLFCPRLDLWFLSSGWIWGSILHILFAYSAIFSLIFDIRTAQSRRSSYESL